MVLFAVFTVIGASPTVMVAGATSSNQTATCSTVVQHNKFRTDNATVDALVNGTTVQSTVQNTRVTLSKTNTFYRLNATNPNGYCVHFIVRVANRGMPPAHLPGKVDSNDGNVTATWEAIYDYNKSQMYTRIAFTLPAASSATFAPSEYRVKILAWKSQGTSKATNWWSNLKSKFSKSHVTKRHYQIKSSSTRSYPQEVVVPLRNPQTGEQVNKIASMYSTNSGKTWKPVGTDTSNPVYKETVQNGSAVRFTFNKQAQVKFVTNPTWLDKQRQHMQAYQAGLHATINKLLGHGGN